VPASLPVPFDPALAASMAAHFGHGGKFIVTCPPRGCGPECGCFVGYRWAACAGCQDKPAVEDVQGTLLCDACAWPCWKCDGVGCRACGNTGSERKRREVAAIPCPIDAEVTERLPAVAGGRR
jgi:hypothetical protein